MDDIPHLTVSFHEEVEWHKDGLQNLKHELKLREHRNPVLCPDSVGCTPDSVCSPGLEFAFHHYVVSAKDTTAWSLHLFIMSRK